MTQRGGRGARCPPIGQSLWSLYHSNPSMLRLHGCLWGIQGPKARLLVFSTPNTASVPPTTYFLFSQSPVGCVRLPWPDSEVIHMRAEAHVFTRTHLLLSGLYCNVPCCPEMKFSSVCTCVCVLQLQSYPHDLKYIQHPDYKLSKNEREVAVAMYKGSGLADSLLMKWMFALLFTNVYTYRT